MCKSSLVLQTSTADLSSRSPRSSNWSRNFFARTRNLLGPKIKIRLSKPKRTYLLQLQSLHTPVLSSWKLMLAITHLVVFYRSTTKSINFDQLPSTLDNSLQPKETMKSTQRTSGNPWMFQRMAPLSSRWITSSDCSLRSQELGIFYDNPRSFRTSSAFGLVVFRIRLRLQASSWNS